VKKIAQDFTAIKSVNFQNVRIAPVKNKHKDPWDLQNFDVSYSYTQTNKHNSLIANDQLDEHQASIGYTYGLKAKSIEPFKKLIPQKRKYYQLIRDFNFNLIPSDFNTINENSISNLEFKINKNAKLIFPEKFLLLHFDEKWIHADYIKSFTSIEPQSIFLFISFLEKLILKLELDIVISTGVINNKIIEFLKKDFLKLNDNIYKKNFLNNKIFLFDKLDIFQLETVIFKCHTIVTCHGAPTHIAGSLGKRIIDIVQVSDEHLKWTQHLNNYNYICRNEFSVLSKKILENLQK